MTKILGVTLLGWLELSVSFMIMVRMGRIMAAIVLRNNTAELPSLNIGVKKMIGKFKNWRPYG